jgi:hypothetical protein
MVVSSPRAASALQSEDCELGGALMFVANIGWVFLGACCLAALALVALFPGFVACIVILIVGGVPTTEL